VELKTCDNGTEFDFSESATQSYMGLSLISDLVNSMGIRAEFPQAENNFYRFLIVSK